MAEGLPVAAGKVQQQQVPTTGSTDLLSGMNWYWLVASASGVTVEAIVTQSPVLLAELHCADS